MIPVMVTPGLEDCVPKIIRARRDEDGRWEFPGLLGVGAASLAMSPTPPADWYPKSPYTVGNRFSLGGYCPYCHERVRFEPIEKASDTQVAGPVRENVTCGQRRCPNDDCAGMVFVIFDDNRDFLRQYPIGIAHYDDQGLPSQVAAAFEEALRCHEMGCDVAAGSMLRRCIEFVCNDKGGDPKTSLHERINSLKGTLSDATIEALQDIKDFGNDAVHPEPRDYVITHELVETAVDVVKHVLLDLYQREPALKRLGAQRKKQSEEVPPDE